MGNNHIEKLDAVSFDTFIAQIDPFKKNVDVFDLSGVKFISPAALVQLSATCYALKEKGRQLKIILNDPAVCSYLARAGFVSALKSLVKFEPQDIEDSIYNHLRGSNPLLIEVTKIEKGTELPNLLNQIVSVLRHRLKYRKYDAFDVATVISEICQNTFDHNKSTCGFLAMQVYGKGTKRFLEIGVADYGDGLSKTLQRNPKNKGIKSDLAAIDYAIKPGTSEHDDPTRGTGLYHLLEIAYKYEGAVQIRSGEGKVRYRMDMRQGWKAPVAYIPGVQIALSLGHKKRVDKTYKDDTL